MRYVFLALTLLSFHAFSLEWFMASGKIQSVKVDEQGPLSFVLMDVVGPIPGRFKNARLTVNIKDQNGNRILPADPRIVKVRW